MPFYSTIRIEKNNNSVQLHLFISNGVMKKIFFIGAFLFFGIAYGQQYITQVSYPDDIVKAIVREYNYPSTISYIETLSDHYFSYADASMTVVNVSIGTDVSVSDFVIYGDYSALLIPSSNLSKCTIQSLRYSGLTKTYSLLLSGVFPAFGVGSHYVEFDPNSAFATVSSLKDVSLSSMDTYNSGTSFVSLGYDMVIPTNVVFHTQPFLSSGLCLQKNTIFVQDDIFARKYRENPYTVCVDTFDCARRVYKNIKELENKTVCSD